LYYVMPFIDGETLRDKLNRETQLGIDEAVSITTAIADALDYAHRQNVIHRDIKPENILLHDGRPMVADFGIALAVSAAAGGRMTETGMSLGTPHYMSPEQATAEKDLTNRSDIYSLGCVLYEMLTGEPPHTGASAQAIVMKIVTEDVQPVTELRKSVPPNVAAAVAKALEKLAADRFESAAKFGEALTNPAFTLSATQATAGAGAQTRGLWNRLSIATTALAAVLGVVALWALLRPAPPMPVSRYSLARQADELALSGGLALSPDGSRFVYPRAVDGVLGLWVRRRDQLRGSPIPGAENGFRPVVSPDGSHVAFFTFGADIIKRVPLDGGPPVVLVDSGVGADGISWGRDGFLYFDGLTGVGTTGIVRVPETGGVPELVTSVDRVRGETDHVWPEVLPNGQGVLFTILRGGDLAQADIAVLDLATGAYRALIRGLGPRFVAAGYLVFVTPDGLLMAVPFDQDRLEVTGEVVAMTDGVRVSPAGTSGSGAVDLALSATGKLMYVTGGGGATQHEIVWVNRDGRTEEIDGDITGPFQQQGVSPLALSPDGRQLVLARAGPDGFHLWVKQLPRGPLTKLTFEGESNIEPGWTPNGRDIVFVSDRGANADLYVKRADGSSAAELLLDVDSPIVSSVLSEDGEWLVYGHGNLGGDISAVRLGRDSVQVALLTTSAIEMMPQLSPDGRWLTYVSNEPGGFEVFVRPFPNVADTRYQVSTGQGFLPRWAHSGRELFYLNASFEMVAVEVLPGPAFAMGERRVLFRISQSFVGYDVGPDDQRFVVIQGRTGGENSELIVVENWLEEFRAKVGRE
ncbi:MAG: serine/threonine-protein kinase, partial [Gemmatimonadetes bacterium]|nr:serine/threonine-protein kinase [Gemmatimonadota bacterium]